MARNPVSQQTSTTLPLRGELARAAPRPRALEHGTFDGPLQWALEGTGWGIMRPVIDFALLCVAVVFAQGGLHATLYASTLRLPLLAFPPLVMLLFYLRGLYRTRLRALVLDGVVPVVSAISVGAMTVAIFGLFINEHAPPQYDVLRAWLFALVAVGLGRVGLSLTQSWARARRLVGKPVLIMGAGRRRGSGGASSRESSRVRADSGRLPR